MSEDCSNLLLLSFAASIHSNGDITVSELQEQVATSASQGQDTNKEEYVHMSSDADFNTNESSDSEGNLNTFKFAESEHSYAKRPVYLSNTVSLVIKTEQKKKRQRNIDVHNEALDGCRIVNEPAPSYFMRVRIQTRPFPYVYAPKPLHPICNVECYSDGDPVYVKEPVFDRPSTCRIPPKQAADNKISSRKSKFVCVDNSSRPVLECVENRVACKSNALSKQKGTHLLNDNFENSENMNKNVMDIAQKNIQILMHHRKKRYCDDEPTDYKCEICERHFTAKSSLINHYKSYLKIKPFKCDECGKTFTRRSGLNYHIMIHQGRNRFQCEICKRLFRHSSHYKEHVRKHTGEEPFSC